MGPARSGEGADDCLQSGFFSCGGFLLLCLLQLHWDARLESMILMEALAPSPFLPLVIGFGLQGADSGALAHAYPIVPFAWNGD